MGILASGEKALEQLLKARTPGFACWGTGCAAYKSLCQLKWSWMDVLGWKRTYLSLHWFLEPLRVMLRASLEVLQEMHWKEYVAFEWRRLVCVIPFERVSFSTYKMGKVWNTKKPNREIPTFIFRFLKEISKFCVRTMVLGCCLAAS